eukprot:scaffold558199_cov59-Attheya_sp.AAC.1
MSKYLIVPADKVIECLLIKRMLPANSFEHVLLLLVSKSLARERNELLPTEKGILECLQFAQSAELDNDL